MTRTGTNHFNSFAAAMNYYRPYMGLPTFTGGDQKPNVIRRGKDKECYNFVANKVANGEISIGPPEIKNGEKLFVDSDGRYVIQVAN